MANFELIKEVKNFDTSKIGKPKIDYANFDVDVDGQIIPIGVPVRESARFKGIMEGSNSFTKRKFRVLMREFRGIRITE